MSPIDYTKILSHQRLRLSTRTGRTILTESESDRGRVLFSPAFRRLQQKAQVFSMEPNAAVRSRLTHSLEVSQLGRYLADEIGQRLVENGAMSVGQQSPFVNFVETACLMHDIGNPPFGHFGEAAIQEWFKANGRMCVIQSLGIQGTSSDEAEDSDEIKFQLRSTLADFLEFDGNPQGLRIVAKLQWNTDEFGLNLTKTTLAAFLKYVRSPLEARSEKNFTKKPGFFASEKEVVDSVWSEFGYKSQRFPLAYIMEAADDIAYCISDLEDSFEKGIIQPSTTFPEIHKRYAAGGFRATSPFHKEIRQALKALVTGKFNDKEFTYTDFRTTLTSAIIQYVASRYIKNQKHIASGDLKSLLPEDEPPGFMLNVLKEFCREKVYKHESIQRVELAGYNAISGLMNQFRPILSASRKRFERTLEGNDKDEGGNRILVEPKLLKLFPPRYFKTYENDAKKFVGHENEAFLEWNARAHLVVDYVSGMTDDFAMTTYRTLAGMRL